VNEVRRAVMHIVIVALVAQALSVAYVMPQFWEILDRLDMMGLKTLVLTAYLAGVLVTLKHSPTPSQIIWTTAALRIPRVATLGNALAFYTAIGVLVRLFQATVNHIRIGSPESFAADCTRAKRRVGKRAAAARAVDCATNVRRRPLKLFSAMLTKHRHLLGLGNGRALTRTVPLFGVLVPATVGFFGDDCPAGFTGL